MRCKTLWHEGKKDERKRRGEAEGRVAGTETRQATQRRRGKAQGSAEAGAGGADRFGRWRRSAIFTGDRI